MAQSNYDLIMEAIEVYDEDEDEFVTIEWRLRHENFFHEIRKFFPDFTDVNLEIRDIDFRNTCAKAEVCARELERLFDVFRYCELCKLCYDMYLACTDDKGDLAAAFGNMNVTKK